MWDLNPQPTAYKAAALPIELTWHEGAGALLDYVCLQPPYLVVRREGDQTRRRDQLASRDPVRGFGCWPGQPSSGGVSHFCLGKHLAQGGVGFFGFLDAVIEACLVVNLSVQHVPDGLFKPFRHIG